MRTHSRDSVRVLDVTRADVLKVPLDGTDIKFREKVRNNLFPSYPGVSQNYYHVMARK